MKRGGWKYQSPHRHETQSSEPTATQLGGRHGDGDTDYVDNQIHGLISYKVRFSVGSSGGGRDTIALDVQGASELLGQ